MLTAYSEFPQRLLPCRAAPAMCRTAPENDVMDRESVERLRFDRRLQHRRGWVEESQYDSHADDLPDVSDKMTTTAEIEAEEAAALEVAADSPPPPPEAIPDRPAPVAGDFSTPGSFGGGGFGNDPGGTPTS